MNANELADELERFESFNGDVFFGTCAAMLRQQQEKLTKYELRNEEQRNRIAHLEAEIESLKIKHDAVSCSSCACGFIKRGKAQEK